MKQLIVRNFGPIETADVEFGRCSLIIGMQSSGKSCLMMLACHCTWVEKRIELRQSAKEFELGTTFMDNMLSYYHIKGYLRSDTYIEYHSQYMSFVFDNNKTEDKFSYARRPQIWKYKRPNVSYVPAERNLLSLISNWDQLKTNYDSILDFKKSWNEARTYLQSSNNILGLGISYEYEQTTETDAIVTSNGTRLSLTNSSSGIQSLVPQYVYLEYLHKGIYECERINGGKIKSYSEQQQLHNLLNILYKRNFQPESADTGSGPIIEQYFGRDYLFYTEESRNKFRKEATNFLNTDHSEIFLEEPEINLFPPTQFQLMDFIVELMNDSKHKNSFYITTHSPYVLSHLLQENLKDFKLILTLPTDSGSYKIREANEQEIQDIYDNGSDAFFNFEAITR